MKKELDEALHVFLAAVADIEEENDVAIELHRSTIFSSKNGKANMRVEIKYNKETPTEPLNVVD